MHRQTAAALTWRTLKSSTPLPKEVSSHCEIVTECNAGWWERGAVGAVGGVDYCDGNDSDDGNACNKDLNKMTFTHHCSTQTLCIKNSNLPKTDSSNQHQHHHTP
jgi:hypothetical protein